MPTDPLVSELAGGERDAHRGEFLARPAHADAER